MPLLLDVRRFWKFAGTHVANCPDPVISHGLACATIRDRLLVEKLWQSGRNVSEVAELRLCDDAHLSRVQLRPIVVASSERSSVAVIRHRSMLNRSDW